MSDPKADARPSLNTSIRAQEEYHDTGAVRTVRCERCGELIKIEPLAPEVLKLTCACGLYNDTLKGL